MMKRILLTLCITILTTAQALATVLEETIYLNRGTFTTVSGSTFIALAYNTSPVFDANNAVVEIATGDTLSLTVFNNDSLPHGFHLENETATWGVMNEGESLSGLITSASRQLIIFFDDYDYPSNRYMGAGGMICFFEAGDEDIPRYFWNIKEHSTDFNNSIANNEAVNWNEYTPDYFTINGKSFPDLQLDETAVVSENVGQFVHIYMANTGQSAHSIHFHGFHSTSIFHTDAAQTNRVKETWPLKQMQGAILEMLADKTGQYSVHDHNLVAVSGGGIHPNGMFLIMTIEE